LLNARPVPRIDKCPARSSLALRTALLAMQTLHHFPDPYRLFARSHLRGTQALPAAQCHAALPGDAQFSVATASILRKNEKHEPQCIAVHCRIGIGRAFNQCRARDDGKGTVTVLQSPRFVRLEERL